MDGPEQRKDFEALSPDEIWEIYLSEGQPGLMKRAPRWLRTRMSLESNLFGFLPSDPRCIWCHAPFSGVGAPMMRAIGKTRSQYNPGICSDCESFARKHQGGADVELTMLFADVRGSTSLAEKLDSSSFSRLISRFYAVTTDVLVEAQGMIDKLIGDEVTAFFVPGFAGKDHTRQAYKAAIEILKATGHADPQGPWVPVGVGIHAGVAHVGVVGQPGGITDITVLGDVPNTASRLASIARAGEVVISDSALRSAQIDRGGLDRRTVDLKGKTEALDIWVFQMMQADRAETT
jgi:adenylate cyclase